MVSENEKKLEIELIEQEIAFTKQKLTLGAKTLPNATLVHLMKILEKLIIRRDYLMGNSDIVMKQYETLEDNPAWRLHKKAQSGFELKVGSR